MAIPMLGAPATEREFPITPKMIEAGVGELFKFDIEAESEQDAVIRIFRAMLRARAETDHPDR
jgi:hypothetical protein